MATIDMKYTYRTANGSGGSGGGGYETGLGLFVAAHLKSVRSQLVLDMSNARRRGEGIVRAKSRVDTGAMRAQVTSTGDFGTDVLKISFGWEPFAPYYAPFQEFGTRNGITPMFAVKTAFDTVVAELRARIGA